jgi:hypothetical protein
MKPTRLRGAFFALLASAALSLAPRSAFAEPTAAECLAAHESSVALRRAHDLRGALDALRTCAATSCPSQVRGECAARGLEVDRDLPTLLFAVKNARGEDVVDAQATMDGEPIALDGLALPLNPGPHVLRVSAPGFDAVEKRLTVLVGEKNRREQLVLAPPVAAQPIPSLRDDVSRATGSGYRTFALGAGALGLVAAGIGLGFGLTASASWDESRRACASATDCLDHGRAVAERDDADRAATVSTISFVVAGVAIGAAIVSLILAPSRGAGSSANAAARGSLP